MTRRTRQRAALARIRPRDLQRKLQRAHAALDMATDSDSLIQATFRVLALEFPGGFTSVTSRNMDAEPNFWLSSRGHRLELGPTPAAFDCHPAAEFVKKHPGVKVSRSSDVLPSGVALRQTEFYKQSMKPMGWRYALALFFWVGGSLIAFSRLFAQPLKAITR